MPLAVPQPALPSITALAPDARALSASPLLRKMSAAQTAWSNMLGDGLDFSTPTTDSAGKPRPITHVRAAATDPRQWPHAKHWPVVHIELAGTSAELRLAPHAQWSELALPAYGLLPQELQLAVAAHVTQDVRALLTASLLRAGLIGSTHCIPVASSPAAADASPHLVVALHLRRHTSNVSPDEQSVWLAVPANVAAPIRSSAPTNRRSGALPLALPLRLVFGTAQIPAGQMRSRLQPGSVVLLERAEPGRRGECCAWLASDDEPLGLARVVDWRAPAMGHATVPQAVQPQIVFDDWFAPATRHQLRSFISLKEPVAMSTSPDGPIHLNSALQDLSVAVEAVIELPAARIPELQALAPGSVLRTATAIDGQHVVLRVAGRAVGRGRLIAIDSLIGLELAELFD